MASNRRLYRSRTDSMIGGVCGGIAEYFQVDPVIVRLIAVILLLPGGLPGFLPYVIMWIVVPEAPLDDGPTSPSTQDE